MWQAPEFCKLKKLILFLGPIKHSNVGKSVALTRCFTHTLPPRSRHPGEQMQCRDGRLAQELLGVESGVR